MIGDDKVAEIRERTDIVSLIGEYVALKRVGASFRGLCPFHSEKSPSFYVHPARQFFHCFGCQASGDVIKFVMQLEGRSFPDSLRLLAERSGIELPTEDQRESDAVRRERQYRERLIAITEAAAGYYLRSLTEHPLAGIARAELEKRRMQADTVAAYRLGYAPHGWDGLARFLQSKGFSLQEAEQAGLVVPRKSGDGYYDRFRHRLMFPIADVHGKIVAFSGRALDPPPGEAVVGDPPAKYVNSPEGPLYKKGELLFGLNEARVELRREGVGILCEGNFDVLAVHQAGLKHVVAPLGTAFTAQQARLLRRYVTRVVLLFDGDKAGRKATRAAYPLLREAGLPSTVVALPQGEDPDSFLRQRGPDALKQLVTNAPSIVEYLLEASASEAGQDPAARAQAIEALGPVLAAVENPVEARLYVERVAQAFNVQDLDAVRAQLRRGVIAAREQARSAVRGRRDDGRPTPSAPAGPAYESSGYAYPDARSNDRARRPDERARVTSGAADAPRPEARAARPGPEPRMERPVESPRPAVPAGPSPAELQRAFAKIPNIEKDLVGCFLDQPQVFGAARTEKISGLLTSREMEAIFGAAARLSAETGSVDAPSLLGMLEREGVANGPARRWLEERLAIQTFDPSGAEVFLESALPLLQRQQIEREQRELMRRIQEALREGDNETAHELMQLRDELFRAGGALQRRR